MTDTIQWEYRVKTLGGFLRGEKDEELEAILNEWGNEGWEVISARGIENTNRVSIIAKRPLTDTARRRRSLPMM
jgi:hypothetical protein